MASQTRPVPRTESPWGMPEGEHKAHRCNDRAEDVIQESIPPPPQRQTTVSLIRSNLLDSNCKRKEMVEAEGILEFHSRRKLFSEQIRSALLQSYRTVYKLLLWSRKRLTKACFEGNPFKTVPGPFKLFWQCMRSKPGEEPTDPLYNLTFDPPKEGGEVRMKLLLSCNTGNFSCGDSISINGDLEELEPFCMLAIY